MEQQTLKPGDRVRMNDRYRKSDRHRGVVFTVSSTPWMCDGTEIIRLEGYKGSIPTDGLDRIEEEHV